MGKLFINFIFLMFFSNYAFGADYIVKYKENKESIFKTESFQALTILDEHPAARLVKVAATDDQKSIIAGLMTNPNIEYVVKDFKLHRFEAPYNPEALQEQWSLVKVQAEKAWASAKNKGSKSVIVAVIDTGVDSKHDSLKDNMLPGYDFKDNDADPNDETGTRNPGHGTHCAGIVGATGTLDGGIAGMSPTVSILPIRFLGADGGGDLMAGIKSIDYAIEKKAAVISASWGATIASAQAKPLIEAVERAKAAGVIFVAAAANDSSNNDTKEVFPANAATISVAASGSADEKPSWSNFGKSTVHLAAPGLAIMSTLPEQKYGNLSGTSMATPLVAGLVAFLKAQDASLTGEEVLALMQTTGSKVEIETVCNCRVDAASATESLLAKTPFFVPAAKTFKVGEEVDVVVKNSGATQLNIVSSNPEVISITNGKAKALKVGEATLSTELGQKTVQSLPFTVAGAADTPTEECPIPDPQLCELLCSISPDLAWCK